GAAVARNKALDLAKGRYIAFLDSDDLWYPEKIHKQIDFMRNNDDIAFCYTAYEMVDDEGILIKEKIKILEKATYKNLLKRTMISTPTVLLDRHLLGNLKMPLRRTGQDYAYWLLLLHNVEFAYGIDEALVKVRRRGNSLSANKFQNIIDVWVVQTQNENLSPIYATYNTVWYVFNSFTKRFL
ncbi:MAG: glycosyltransferase, partial [Crenarchaeota archaeon]|nr:glycosyltransferase [Thermoproteota archaeon]